MILELYGVLIALSIVMILIGSIKTIDNPAFRTLGFFFLFLLAFTFLNSDLEYKSGQTETVTNNVTAIVYDYTAFSDSISKTIGLYFAIGSAIGFALSIANGFGLGAKK